MTKKTALRAKWTLTAQEINGAVDKFYSFAKEVCGKFETRSLNQSITYDALFPDDTFVIEQIMDHGRPDQFRLPRTHKEFKAAFKKLECATLDQIKTDEDFVQLSHTDKRETQRFIRQVFAKTINSIGNGPA